MFNHVIVIAIFCSFIYVYSLEQNSTTNGTIFDDGNETVNGTEPLSEIASKHNSTDEKHQKAQEENVSTQNATAITPHVSTNKSISRWNAFFNRSKLAGTKADHDNSTSSNHDPTNVLSIKCALNEELKKCGTSCPKSCGDLVQANCDDHCIADICQCREGFVVHPNGTCIHPSDCPAAETKTCPPNSHIASCGSICAPTCDQPTPTVCTLQCIIDVCVCDETFVLNEQKQCVKLEDCPQKHNETCGVNEQFSVCGSLCEPTCDEPFPAFCSDECAKNTCQCDNGFVRNPHGKCVLVTECLL